MTLPSSRWCHIPSRSYSTDVVCNEIWRGITSCRLQSEKRPFLCWGTLVCIAVINQSERESEVQVFIVRAKRIFFFGKDFPFNNKKRELGNRNMMNTKRFIRKNVFLVKSRCTTVWRMWGQTIARVINVFLFDCEKMWNDALMASLTHFGEEHSNTLQWWIDF